MQIKNTKNREGLHSQHDIEILEKRTLSLQSSDPNYPMAVTHLFSTNMAVDQHNNEIFNKSSNEKASIKTVDIIIGDLSDELK